MSYDRKLLSVKLRRWQHYMQEFSLPEWDELPAFDLYMEQVVSLLTDYLDYLLYETDGDNIITPSTVNNYVRMRIMPAPIKKRYSRIHLAYLIIICTLKQSLNISYVQKLLPYGLSEDEVKRIYNDFVRHYKHTTARFIEYATEPARGAFEQRLNDEQIVSMVAEMAISANIYKLFTEKMIRLQGVSCSDLDPAEIIE